MTDAHDLASVIDAPAMMFEAVPRQVRPGRKTLHWMRFVCPQIAELGQSATSRRHAIRSRNPWRARRPEAAILNHPV
jgi:uncharacterized protein (DUF1810 family)